MAFLGNVFVIKNCNTVTKTKATNGHCFEGLRSGRLRNLRNVRPKHRKIRGVNNKSQMTRAVVPVVLLLVDPPIDFDK